MIATYNATTAGALAGLITGTAAALLAPYAIRGARVAYYALEHLYHAGAAGL